MKDAILLIFDVLHLLTQKIDIFVTAFFIVFF